MAKDYGVLIEDQGVSLRGMFIIDGEGIVQQVSQHPGLPLANLHTLFISTEQKTNNI